MLDIDKRLNDMPVMASRPDYMEAHYFNIWRRSRARWGTPMRFSLPGLKEINMVLTDKYWACIDSVKYDVPVLAWVDMEHDGRNSLHEPIPCITNYYHFAASAIRAKSLNLMAELLSERLKNAP